MAIYRMLFSALFERFVAKKPMAVMARAVFENALAPSDLDALFRSEADAGYERKLLFSSMVDLMTVVVAKVQPSLKAAFEDVHDTLPASLTAVYEKVAHVEPNVTRALVRHVAARTGALIDAMGGVLEPLLPGYEVRIVDGNHLAATERRLAVLRGSSAGPLPGFGLVVLDPQRKLLLDLLPCEDGHAQERSLVPELLALVRSRHLYLLDRNFCTFGLLRGIVSREAFFVVRHHANLTVLSSGTRRAHGRCETGHVFEEDVTVGTQEHPETLSLRRIVVVLDTPTRDGDRELALLTNLPAQDANAVTVAQLYRKRWGIETAFLELTRWLEGEIDTLGYPRAALFGFGVALCAYNVLSVLHASLRATFGRERVENEVSSFYIANEVRAVSEGLDVAIDEAEWAAFERMPPATLAPILLRFASHARLRAYPRARRAPKKPVTPRTKHKDTPHVSTQRLLEAVRQGKRP